MPYSDPTPGAHDCVQSGRATKRKPTLENFAEHLTDAGRAEHTVTGYVQDLRVFARWFEQTTGQELAPDKLTSHDARACSNKKPPPPRSTANSPRCANSWQRDLATVAAMA